MQLAFPQLALTGTPEPIFIKRLRAEHEARGTEVERMIAGQKWLEKRR